MAQDPGLTPEKQLLNLIEASGGGQSQAATPAEQRPPAGKAAPKKSPKAAASRISLSALIGVFSGRLSFFKRNAQKKIKAKRGIGLSFSAVNKFLTVAVVLLFFYVASDVTFSMIELKKSPNFMLQNEKMAAAGAASMTPLRDQAYYFQKIAARDIFRGEGERKEKKKEGAKAVAAVPEVGEKFKSLSLVGISWSSNPDAIIENKTKQQTYFIKRGQMIEGDIKVESILKDKVVLSYDGEEFELK